VPKYKFSPKGSLGDFRELMQNIYGVHDDRFYSMWDLMSNLERYTMRALKGIRKNDTQKLTHNLLISISWAMAIANRLHISVDGRLWERFPFHCSYCGECPCQCRTKKVKKRIQTKPKKSKRPKSLAELQSMFQAIYPAESRTLDHAGVHLAEEVGEVSEALHAYMGEHKPEQLNMIRDEIADFFSCVFGVANSAKINLAEELAKLYSNNCHLCHAEPCFCTFSTNVLYKS
jgi:NTP pyrophosphatase (non-canonical NTP hydrolase)